MQPLSILNSKQTTLLNPKRLQPASSRRPMFKKKHCLFSCPQPVNRILGRAHCSAAHIISDSAAASKFDSKSPVFLNKACLELDILGCSCRRRQFSCSQTLSFYYCCSKILCLLKNQSTSCIYFKTPALSVWLVCIYAVIAGSGENKQN